MQAKVRKVPGQLTAFANQVAGFLTKEGVQAKTIFNANLCIEELLLNTMEYGYRDRDDYEIDVVIRLINEELVIEIVDDARAFDPTRGVRKPDLDSLLDDRQIGGLGIHLVRNLVNSMEYKRAEGRNHLVLRLGKGS